MESVQRKATKLMPELKDKTYEERLMYLKIPSLVYRRKKGDYITTVERKYDLKTPLLVYRRKRRDSITSVQKKEWRFHH